MSSRTPWTTRPRLAHRPPRPLRRTPRTRPALPRRRVARGWRCPTNPAPTTGPIWRPWWAPAARPRWPGSGGGPGRLGDRPSRRRRPARRRRPRRRAGRRGGPLGPADVPEMLDLVARTRPGPFLPRTIELGTYLGIRRTARSSPWRGNGCARRAGPRSARSAPTPTVRGQGLATRLILAVAHGIRERGETPSCTPRPATPTPSGSTSPSASGCAARLRSWRARVPEHLGARRTGVGATRRRATSSLQWSSTAWRAHASEAHERAANRFRSFGGPVSRLSAARE